MQRTTLICALVAALAVAAIAAPASLARPIDSYTPKTKEPAAESQQPATEAPARPLDRYTPEAQPFAPEAPLYRSDDSEAGRPQSADDETPWAVIGLAVTGGCLLLAGVATASIRARRARVAA